MKDLGKRLLSMLVVLVMVLSMVPTLPVYVHAELNDATEETSGVSVIVYDSSGAQKETLTETTIEGSVLAAYKGNTIVLQKPITLNAANTILQNMTIDLNGQKLTIGEGSYLYIRDTVTFKDSQYKQPADLEKVAEEAAKYPGGIEYAGIKTESQSAAKHCFSLNRDGSTLKFESVKFTTAYTEGGAAKVSSVFNSSQTNTALSFENCYVDVDSATSYIFSGDMSSTTNKALNVFFTNTVLNTGMAGDKAKHTFRLANITAKNSKIDIRNAAYAFAYTVGTFKNTDVTVSATAYYCASESDTDAIMDNWTAHGIDKSLVFDACSSFIVEDGSKKDAGNKGSLQVNEDTHLEGVIPDGYAGADHSWTAATCTTPKTCSVCDATEGDVLSHSYTYQANNDGTHNGVCANGCGVADNGNCDADGENGACSKCGYVAENYVAQIGDVKYESLEEAFSAAGEGDTIKLLADATPALTSQRAITKAAVIDLDGKTLTLTEDDLYFGTTTFKNGTVVVDSSVKPSTAVFWMFANQTLTFDNVKLVATGVTGTYLIGLDGNNSDLNLLNGSEIVIDNTTALDLDVICVNATTGNDIVIDNSKVSVTNLDGRVFFRGNYTVSGNSDIDLSGITKAGFRIEAGQTLSIEDTATVDIVGEPRDGGIHLTDLTAIYSVADTATVNATVNEPVVYVAQISNVKYESLEEAFAAAVTGDTITLLNDVTVTEKFNLNGVNLDLNGKTLYLKTTGNYVVDTVTISNGTIDISDNAVNGNTFFTVGGQWAKAGSVLNLEEVKLDGDGYTTDWAVICVHNGTSLNMSGCTVDLKNDNGTGGGFIKDTSGNSNTATITITDTKLDLTNIDRGFTGGKVTLDTVELTITGGEHGINGPELTIKDSTVSISDGTGRGITLNKYDASVVNSTVTLSNMGEGGIRFKTGNALTVDADSTFAQTTAHADVAGATVNGQAVTGTEDDMSTVTVASGTTTVVNPAYAAEVDGVGYKNLADALAAANTGDTITLLQDVKLTSTLKITSAINLNLNGKTITSTAKCAVQVSGGNADLAVKISNGKIVAAPNSSASGSSALSVYDGADVTVENVELSGGYYGIKISGYASYPSNISNNNLTSVVLDGGSVTAENAAIIGLGAYPNTQIDINGANVTSADSIAIYHPSYGTLNITDGTIAGTTAIYLKAGNLNISGGTFVANGEKVDYVYENSGATATGDAIVIESCNYGGYPTPVVSITGGTFTSANNKAVASYNTTDAEAVTSFISGGTFSSAVPEDLCAEGYIPADNGDGTYGIKEFSTANAYVSQDTHINGWTTVWGQLTINGTENFYVEIYSGDTYLGKTTLVDAEKVILNGTDREVTWHVFLYGSDSWWNTEWAVAPVCNLAPTNVKYYVDGQLIGAGVVKMSSPDDLKPVVWGALRGVYSAAKIGDAYYATVADALAAAQNGDTVIIFADTYTGDLTIDKPITVQGETDKNGNNLVTFNGKLNITADNATAKNLNIVNTGNGCYVNAKDVLIEGCEISGNNGLRYCYTDGTITFRDSKITGSTYGIHFDGNCDGNVVIENCEITGWTSFASTIDHVSIKDTKFLDGNYNLLRFYQNATVEGCTFPSGNADGYATDGMRIDSGNGGIGMEGITVTFTNCNTADGTDLEGAFPGEVIVASDVYVNNVLLTRVAKIDDVYYKTLADALIAAADGETIELLWTEGDDPIAMNGAVYGKTVTITGTATVDWSKGYLFIGRGGEGNGTVIFDNANLTSASNSSSTGIHVSGREKNTTNKYDGTLVIKNSAIELDYLINKGTMALDNSTLTVKNGFSIGGRPASETESGVDATATLNLTNGSKVVVNKHNGMGLGYEAIGVMSIDATSSFETTQSFLVTAKGTMNIAGTATVAGTLTNNGQIVLTDVAATLTSSECGNVTTNVADYKVAYENGVYKLIEKVYVAQIGDVKYESLAEAVAAANNGDTITVIADHELTATVVVDKNVTIDLGGKTITNVCGTHAFRIAADVTVKNGTVDSSAGGYTFIVGYNTPVAGNLTVESGNYYGSTTVVSITYGSATINGGYFEATAYNGAYDFTFNCVDRFYAAGQAKITVNGGEFKNFNPENNAAEVAGTNFVADGYAALPTLNDTFVVGEKPSATVNDLGAITVPAGDYMVYGSGDNTMDMPLSFVMQFLADQNAEDMTNSPFAEWYGDFVITFTGIENGSFTADGCYLAGHYGSFGWVKVPVDGMTIEEGARYPVMLGVGMGQKYDYICSSVQDFKCAMFLDPEILAANPNLKVTLELGVVDNSKGEDAAASALINNESVYSVTDYDYDAEDFLPNVAKIGDVYYKTLADAIAEAVDDDVIKLIADVEVTGSVTINKNITLDIGEYNITRTTQNSSAPAVLVSGGADVTITGTTGTVTAFGPAVWAYSGNVTINGGNYVGGNHAVYASGTSNVVINAGKFSISDEADLGYVLNILDADRATSTITVTGGSFYNFNPKNNTAEGVSTNFCAPGYKGVEDNGIWTVQINEDVVAWNADTGVEYETVMEALLAAFGSNATVKLIKDCAESHIMVPAGVTLDLNGYRLTAISVATFSTSAIIDSVNAVAIGEGKLIIADAANLAVPKNNSGYLPVWDGEGYVFVKVDVVNYKVGFTADNKAEIKFYNGNAASDVYLGNVMEQIDNDLTVKIVASWTSNGDTASQVFAISETLEAKYGEDAALQKEPVMVFRILGAENLENFQLTVVFAYEIGDTVVEVSGETVSVF